METNQMTIKLTEKEDDYWIKLFYADDDEFERQVNEQSPEMQEAIADLISVIYTSAPPSNNVQREET